MAEHATGRGGTREIRDAAAEDLPLLEHVLPSDGDHARQLANAVAGRRDFLVACSAGAPVGTVVVRWTGVPVDGSGACRRSARSPSSPSGAGRASAAGWSTPPSNGARGTGQPR